MWTDETPRSIRESYRTAPDERRWAAWRKYLARRKNKSSSRLLSERRSPLLWAMATEADADGASKLVELLSGAVGGKKGDIASIEDTVTAWLNSADGASGSSGLCHRLPCLCVRTAWTGRPD